ncbi:MAG TPA: ribonuclease D [Thermoanaerobaculia bacterium]|nr:ribonuclease D [Thermoanaerobaculia bacterium]
MSPPGHEWISSRAELERAARRWAGAPALAIDTEFVFERTYRPRLGLVQIGDQGGVALVDPVALGDLEPLAGLLVSPAVEKVVHAGAADVYVLQRAAGAAPRPVFDTQVAAAFAGLGSALSYGALMRELFGVELSKHETRTDWLRRPLRQEQIRYAVEDVERLLEAASELKRRLGELGRIEWAHEDSTRLTAAEEVEPESAWHRVRGIGRLPPAARRVARALAAWREREAERQDLARPFLLRDETLLALARRAELTAKDATKLPGYEPRRHAAHVEAWSAALAEARERAARASDEDEPRKLTNAEIEAREILDEKLAAAVAARAEELALAPELLLSRRQRQRLIAHWDGSSPISAHLEGFRKELLGPTLDAAATAG